jgi:hypothetical protein
MRRRKEQLKFAVLLPSWVADISLTFQYPLHDSCR